MCTASWSTSCRTWILFSVQPYGARYKLDKEQKYVKWFGFEFYITTA